MEFSVLEPTQENIILTMKNNVLGRNEEVYSLASFCNDLEKKSSIAIDAPWGSGKTFFIKQTKLLLDVHNPMISDRLSEDDIQGIKESISPYVSDDGLTQQHISVYYDAWNNDNDEDPLLSIIYEIVRTTGIDYEIKKHPGWIESGKKLANFFTEDKASKLLDLFEKDNLLQTLEEQKGIQQRIEDFITKLLDGEDSRLILFIDELDRCKPSFAVSLLERVKHYFSNERVTIVYSVNLKELSHTIKHVYGQGFNSDKYLDKFFNWRFPLSTQKTVEKYRDIQFNQGKILFDDTCEFLAKHYDLSLRETGLFSNMAKQAFKRSESFNKEFDSEPLNERLWTFAKHILLPIAVATNLFDSESYSDFIEGQHTFMLQEFQNEFESNLDYEFEDLLIEMDDYIELSYGYKNNNIDFIEQYKLLLDSGDERRVLDFEKMKVMFQKALKY